MTTDTDRKFIADPNRWPNWPILPVIRTRGGVTETALIGESGGMTFRIARGANMFDPPRDRVWEPITVAEIVEEGWEVD